jgi:hypothetical protein
MAGYQMPTDEGIVGAKNVQQLATVDPGSKWNKPAADTAKVPSDYASQWSLEKDPTYQFAIKGGQSAFNTARANALASLQNQQTSANRQLQNMKQQGAIDRRNLAGDFAARGMQGGTRGAYYRAQDQANAADIAAQTSIKDQLASLNNQFLQNYGDVNSENFDWTATLSGQDYKNQAIQQALASILSQYGAA